MKALTAVILAAGDSKRMRSKLPKAYLDWEVRGRRHQRSG